MNDEHKFTYTYSAPTERERREIEDIKKQYSPEVKQKTKLERLRELDAKVKNIPLAISVTVGIIGVLIFGLGLTMVLEWSVTVWGVIVAAIGCIPMGLAYPLHKLLTKKIKNKYSAEILALSSELLGEK